MKPGDKVEFDSDQTGITKGTIKSIDEEKNEVSVRYITYDYAMGSTVQSPRIAVVDKSDVRVTEKA